MQRRKFLQITVAVFAPDGEKTELRVASSEQPKGGWAKVPVAGSAMIVNNEFRRHTAVVTVTLPGSPAESNLYYTVWKDGKDVTADGRIGTDACGPGTGLWLAMCRRRDRTWNDCRS